MRPLCDATPLGFPLRQPNFAQALAGGCPDNASCKAISGTGICTYDSVTAEDAAALQVELSQPKIQAVIIPQMNTAKASAPDVTHYEDPNAGPCQEGEQAVQITGIQGGFCSPKCGAFRTCTKDVPVRGRHRAVGPGHGRIVWQSRPAPKWRAANARSCCNHLADTRS